MRDRIRPHHLAVGGDDLGREEVVAGQSPFSMQQAHTTSERESRNPGHRDLAASGGTSKHLRLAIEVPPGHPSLGSRRPRNRIDLDTFHQGEVDHETVIGFADAAA